ncbi:MAG: response regulator [Treponema sp.]|jgi:signal transduction histidine kinase/DNA-binding response OmpR family regulator/HPt (histidine-containing phosphotransfer) domain-containing protein|nr:response regulator [Treponema sp.]
MYVKKENDPRYSELPDVVVPLSILFYGIFRFIHAISVEEFRQATIAGWFTAAALVLVLMFRFFSRKFTPAFVEPMMLFAFYIAASLIQNSFVFFFEMCLAICGIAALYLNSKKLLWYIVCSSLISLILVMLDIPLKNSAGEVPLSEGLVKWFLMVAGSVFIFMVTRAVSQKTGRTANTRDHLSMLLATMPTQVVLLDSSRRVTHMSRVFAEMIHLKDSRAAVGKPLLDLFHDNEEVKNLFIKILKHEGRYEDITRIMLDGQQRYFRIISGRLDGKIGGSQINMIDVTCEMIAKSEAEAASASKSAFLATMSHEIRTPLNAIIGLSEIELQKKLPEETYTNLEKVYNSGSNLLGIINDILDISKIEAGSFEFVMDVYEITSLINDAVQMNVVRIGAKKIEFELIVDETLPSKLYGDELRVKQILNNLLSNAFKYTDRGTISLRVDWGKRDNDAWLTFTISDTGHGIKRENMDKLFSQYAQVDARANRNIEGTGLGLSITKNLVARMDGSISVESEYGKGSTFTVRIRQEIIDPAPIGLEAAENLRQYRFIKNKILSRIKNLIRSYMPYGKVLIVDDVETNLDVVKGLMLPYGLIIDCVSSGREAIEKVQAMTENPQAQKYDVIFMDHMMPEMDGVEAVRIIRSEIDDEYARTVPIIALTANALSGNEEMFLTRGFTSYISKPIDIMQMDLALNTWVRNKQTEETLRKAEYEKIAKAAAEAFSFSGLFEGLQMDGIDLAAGRNRYNNDAAYLRIIKSYCDHAPELLEKIRNFSIDEMQQYIITVHGLKGASYGISAEKIGKYAEALEMAAKAGDIETINAKNSGLVEETEDLLKILNGILFELEKKKKQKPRASAPDRDLMIRILDACKQHDLPLMEEALLEIEQFDYDADGELVPWLREQVNKLGYNAIQERLENGGF